MRVALGADPMGDMAERRQHLERAREIYAQLGNVGGETRSLIGLADLDIGSMDGASALEHITEARDTIQPLGAVRIEADLTFRTGLAILARSDEGTYEVADLDQAVDQFEAAIAAYRELGVVLDGLAPRLHRAIAYLSQGHTEVALREFVELETHYDALGFVPGLAGARFGQAATLFASDQAVEGYELVRDLTATMPTLQPIGEELEVAFESGEIVPFSARFFEIFIRAEQQIAAMNNGPSE